MLALAIEFSRCPRVRTLKAEQRVPPAETGGASVINLESSDAAERIAGVSECQ
jgi:hypothetical protein